MFNYIGINKTMNQLAATLSRSTKDIGGFAVMFAVFFFAYAQFGYLVFGTQVKRIGKHDGQQRRVDYWELTIRTRVSLGYIAGVRLRQ